MRIARASCAVGLLAALGNGAPVAAEIPSLRREVMPFHRCIGLIKELSDSLGATPIGVLQTRDVRIVRIEAIDGIVLVTCSRPDGTVTVARQERRPEGS